MPPLPSHMSPTLQAIHARRVADSLADQQGDNTFIRASGAYHECARATWLTFRWASAGEIWSARMLRLLETGHMHEARILTDLEKIEGATVHRVDPETGEQFQIDIAGYIRGHTDGAMVGVPEAPKTWHLIECKTANEKSFAAIKAKGVERAKPEHWLQVQLYMRGCGLKRCLYFLVNKNTDEEYVERIRVDVEQTERAVARLIEIAEAPRPPAKFRDDASKPPCLFCRHKGLCHEGATARVNCRTCAHSTPMPGGIWRCERFKKSITPEEQAAGCGHHVYIPDLVNGEQVDCDPDIGTITYKMHDGSTWTDGVAHAK